VLVIGSQQTGKIVACCGGRIISGVKLTAVVVYGSLSGACHEPAGHPRCPAALAGDVDTGVRHLRRPEMAQLALPPFLAAGEFLTAWWLKAGYHVLTMLFVCFTMIYGWAALRG
jgi:hypothetical protein